MSFCIASACMKAAVYVKMRALAQKSAAFSAVCMILQYVPAFRKVAGFSCGSLNVFQGDSYLICTRLDGSCQLLPTPAPSYSTSHANVPPRMAKSPEPMPVTMFCS